MTEEKPYTLCNLIFTLIALGLEGGAMVAGITRLAFYDPHMGAGVAYLFAVLIALFSVCLGALQIHYYRTDRRGSGREE